MVIIWEKKRSLVLLAPSLKYYTEFSLRQFRLRVRSFGVIWIRISDPRSLGSWCIKGTGESVTTVDSWVPLMHHYPSDITAPDPDHPKGANHKIKFVLIYFVTSSNHSRQLLVTGAVKAILFFQSRNTKTKLTQFRIKRQLRVE